MTPERAPGDLLARVDAAIEELAALRALLTAPQTDDAALAELLAAIRLWTGGDFCFSTSELVLHARLPAAASLSAAIVGAVGSVDAKRLGQLFHRVKGRTIGGLRIERCGEDSAGIVWSIMEC